MGTCVRNVGRTHDVSFFIDQLAIAILVTTDESNSCK